MLKQGLLKKLPTGHRRKEILVMAGFVLCAVVATIETAWAQNVRMASTKAGDTGGAIYAMTNASSGNEILVFLRGVRGQLHAIPGATVPTGGAGASDFAQINPLGSQGSLVYDDDLGFLFAVNAGDNSVSVFDTKRSHLRPRLVANAPSGGQIPVSVAVREDRLYVLNAGDTGVVATFAIDASGELTLIGAMELGLLAGGQFNPPLAPGQVGVDELSRRLIVVNGGRQEVLVADLDDDGVPVGMLTSTMTPGLVPFAFDTTRYGSIVVAEAGSGSVSAFDSPVSLSPLTVTASAIPSGQAATCWIIVHENGFVYTSNTGGNTISHYRHSRTGTLQLVESVAATSSGAPIDLTLAGDGRFLYTLDASSGSISGFSVNLATGALSPVDIEGGLPASAGIQGIASRDF